MKINDMDDWDGEESFMSYVSRSTTNGGAVSSSTLPIDNSFWVQQPYANSWWCSCGHGVISITRKEYKALRKAAKRDPDVARALDRLASKMELSTEIKFWDLVPD